MSKKESVVIKKQNKSGSFSAAAPAEAAGQSAAQTPSISEANWTEMDGFRGLVSINCFNCRHIVDTESLLTNKRRHVGRWNLPYKAHTMLSEYLDTKMAAMALGSANDDDSSEAAPALRISTGSLDRPPPRATALSAVGRYDSQLDIKIVDLERDIEGVCKQIERMEHNASCVLTAVKLLAKFNDVSVRQKEMDRLLPDCGHLLLLSREQLFEELEHMRHKEGILRVKESQLRVKESQLRAEKLQHMAEQNRERNHGGFRPMGPAGINGNPLFDREESAQMLANCLMSGLGLKRTPFMDSCYGAGKSSLAYKFRDVLKDWKKPEGYAELEKAVYINIRCDTAKMLHVFADCFQPDSLSVDVYRMVAVDLVSHYIKTSYHDGVPLTLDCSSVEAFVSSLNSCTGTTRFILHFDEIGVFERYGSMIATKMIYTIWKLGDTLQECGHYYLLSGRSALLYTIGQNYVDAHDLLHRGQRTQSQGDYTSPCRAQMISLPPLRDESVAIMFESAGIKLCEDDFRLILDMCGGIPRAVQAAIRHVGSLNGKSLDKQRLEGTIWADCAADCSIQAAMDRSLFAKCLECAKAGLWFLEDAKFRGETLASVIAKCGIYTRQAADGAPLFQFVVPGYIEDLFHSFERSIVGIAQDEDAGYRLERGFKRVFHLRHAVQDLRCWKDMCLPFLDVCEVPFPPVGFQESFILPKIMGSRDKKPDDTACAVTMSAIHANALDEKGQRKEFSHEEVPMLLERMRTGQYYKSTPRSSWADATVRVDDNVVVCFQFKNFCNPLTEADLRDELAKSQAGDWRVYLVIICSAGHKMQCRRGNVGEDTCIQFPNGPPCIVLSKSSVQKFLGDDAFASFQGLPLLEDAAARGQDSPLRHLGRTQLIAASRTQRFGNIDAFSEVADSIPIAANGAATQESRSGHEDDSQIVGGGNSLKRIVERKSIRKPKPADGGLADQSLIKDCVRLEASGRSKTVVRSVVGSRILAAAGAGAGAASGAAAGDFPKRQTRQQKGEKGLNDVKKCECLMVAVADC